MGKCKYCGQDAGLFYSKHAECEQRHLKVQSKVLQELLNGQVSASRITISGSSHFMLNNNEHKLWLLRDVTLQMQKVRRETVGRSSERRS